MKKFSNLIVFFLLSTASLSSFASSTYDSDQVVNYLVQANVELEQIAHMTMKTVCKKHVKKAELESYEAFNVAVNEGERLEIKNHTVTAYDELEALNHQYWQCSNISSRTLMARISLKNTLTALKVSLSYS